MDTQNVVMKLNKWIFLLNMMNCSKNTVKIRGKLTIVLMKDLMAKQYIMNNILKLK